MAMVAALQAEKEECTFAPELTAHARNARSRSAWELSIGDAALREAKQVVETTPAKDLDAHETATSLLSPS